MKASTFNRRKFIRSATAATSAAGLLSMLPAGLLANRDEKIKPDADEKMSKYPGPRINFTVIGINHGHINSQMDAVIRGGGEFVSFHAKENDLAEAFSKKYPQTKRVLDEKEILQDKSIQLILS